MPRTRIPLALGRGLDRATGLGATQPQYPSDARNVYARDAKVALRPGMAGTGLSELTWGTDLLALIGVKATNDLLYVVYDRTSREIRVYRMDPSTGLIQTLSASGLWGTLNASAPFPVISYDESDGCVMLAHAEASYALRLPTVYYTPNFVTPATVGTLTILEADLDGSGVAQPVFFNAVCTHLEYLTGAGYGSASDPDRGDILRVSRPADPTTWLASNYVIFGVKKQPIVGMKPVSSVLGVSKNDETWILDGAVASQFSPRRIDAHYGTVSARGMLSVGSRLFQWASDGPREVTPAETIPIGQALELISPLPVDLAVRGPERLMFSTYDTARYLGEWCWPDIEAARSPVCCFALSLWSPQDPRWTFFEREQPISCAGVWYSAEMSAAPAPPAGYVTTVLAVDV